MAHLQHQWPSKTAKGLYRVRFFISKIIFTDYVNMSDDQVYWDAANQFKRTNIYEWVEENNVKLHWAEDDNVLAWHKQVVFYGDITEKQMVDYILRFC